MRLPWNTELGNNMNALEYNLKEFGAIDLEGLNTIRLMKRYDTKFVFHREMLPYVFDCLKQDYAILEMFGNRIFAYQTLYYDTDDYLFYHQHHDQRVNRYKIRCRRYVDTEQCYIEVKCKNNKKKMIKTRLLLGDPHIPPELPARAGVFAKSRISNGCRQIVDDVKPVLWVTYDRITLANINNMERITFDVNLEYSGNSETLLLDPLVVAELKRPRACNQSDFFRLLKTLDIFPSKFSKYCMGVVLLKKNIKMNRFKETVLRLKKNGFIPENNQHGNAPYQTEEWVENPAAAYGCFKEVNA